MKLYYSDTFELPLPAKHRFPMAKYTQLRERLLATPEIADVCSFLLPPAASDSQLKLVHDAPYINAIKSGKLTEVQQRRIGFPWSEKMVERSRRSTGASIAAGRSALADGISVNLAGGTHHSFPSSGQGYCVFNDVCVAARSLQEARQIQTALFVDLDVHQGNGTAAIAKEDMSLFSFSMHCDKNYPFQKTEGDLDIALAEGTEDEEYLAQLKTALANIEKAFDPDIVFYLAGADPFQGDRLGLLNLTKPGLAERDQIVLDYFRDRDIPVAISMAGGYAPVLEDIVDIHFSTIQCAVERMKKDRILAAFQ